MSTYQDLLACEERLDSLESSLKGQSTLAFSPLDLPFRNRDGIPEDILTLGLVGGTGVGKSTIVNALAGKHISKTSVRRPTTSRVIPYLHQDHAALLPKFNFVKNDLDEFKGLHEVQQLKSIIIFDLPDMDGSKPEHAAVVHRALQGLDLIVWVTSDLKYNDRIFHEWLARHGATRNLNNAVFLLNKIDRVREDDPHLGAEKLLQNFRHAVEKTLSKAETNVNAAQFFTCSAKNPHAQIPGNQFAEFFDYIAKERSLQEIRNIKSSDRLSSLQRRVEHINKSINFEKRQEELSTEIDLVREKLKCLTEEPPIHDEMLNRLQSSSAPQKIGAELFAETIQKWPLLPHLQLLASPLKQVGRILNSAKLLLPQDQESKIKNRPFPRLLQGMLAMEKERRRLASRAPTPLLNRNREQDQLAIESRLVEVENECVLRIQEGLGALQGTSKKTSTLSRWKRRMLVWAPLLWFPLVQPLAEEILRPTRGLSTLSGRLAFRLVRMSGAVHLMVSAAFVLMIYVIYIALLRAAAYKKVVSRCRRFLNSSEWKDSFLDQLTTQLTKAESTALGRMREEELELKEIVATIQRLNTEIESSAQA